MRVLLTRPRPDSEILAAELGDRGIDCLIAPALEIEEEHGPPLDLARVQAALVTSGNGARALARRTGRRDMPVLAVGERTAGVLRAAGFEHVHSADGNAADLAALATGRLDPAAGPVLLARGRDVAADLAGVLARHGFAVEEAVLYRARPAKGLPEAVRAALAGGEVDAALFFSPRSAATFVSLAREAGVGEACARVAALCLSAAVAAELGSVPWRRTAVARHPRKADLLALLDEAGAGQP